MDVSVLGTDTRVSNFTQELHTLIQRRIGLNVIDAAEGDRRTTVGALDVLGYIYAVVNSTYYRERIADLVAEDYPRVPFTSDRERFQHLSQLGTELIRYHTDPSAAGPISIYPIAGTDLVVRERWEGQGDMGSIWINPTQYFAEVPRSVWEYRIGGWQVVQEWLKRRRGKILNPDQILRFQYIMGALAQSVDVIERIDEYVDDDLIERGV
jgi:predicted helicase